jgi:hypothetical protein
LEVDAREPAAYAGSGGVAMRRRKLRWAVAGLAVLLLTAGVFAPWSRSNRITRENCERITEGMSREEVYAILGPPGDYRSVRTVDPNLLLVSTYAPTPAMLAEAADHREHVFVVRIDYGTGLERLTWLGDDGDIFVWLSPAGVWSNGMTSSEKMVQSPFDNLLWRAKRQWRSSFPRTLAPDGGLVLAITHTRDF